MEYLFVVNILLIIGVVAFCVWAYKQMKAVYRYNAETLVELVTDHAAMPNPAELKEAETPADDATEEPSPIPEYSDGDEEEIQDEWWKGMGNKALFERCMEELGCKYERDEEKTYEYRIKYQGEIYIIHVGDDFTFIRLYDMFWYEVPMDDLDIFSEARRLVNEININNIAPIVYSIDKEKNVMYLHTYTKGLFSDFIPMPDKYLERIFNDMMSVQRIFLVKLAQFKGEEA